MRIWIRRIFRGNSCSKLSELKSSCFYLINWKLQGIWNDRDEKLRVQDFIGADARDKRRLEIDGKFLTPVGLVNLGATCYLNALVQSLYHNLLIRDAIFNLNANVDGSILNENSTGSTKMDLVLQSLQKIFGYLWESDRSTYSLNDFADLLRLDRFQQQDPQEFSKLFLSRIEKLRAPPIQPSIRTLTNLLSGVESHITRCLNCGYQSHRSDVFFELDLSLTVPQYDIESFGTGADSNVKGFVRHMYPTVSLYPYNLCP